MIEILFGSDTYGAKDVNIAMSRMLTAGVVMTKFDGGIVPIGNATAGTVVNSASTLNEDACKVVSQGGPNYQYIIRNGSVIMPSGTIIRFAGELTTILPTAKTYVYLSQSINGGAVTLKKTSEPPTEFDVPLALIEYDSIRDMRNPAYSRLQIPAWSGLERSGTIQFDVNNAEEHYIELSNMNFSHCFMKNQRLKDDDSLSVPPVLLTHTYKLLGYRRLMAYYVKREGARIYIKTKKSGFNTGDANSADCKISIF